MFVPFIYFQEFESPHRLLQNPDSLFMELVKNTGTATQQELIHKAREAAMKRHVVDDDEDIGENSSEEEIEDFSEMTKL